MPPARFFVAMPQQRRRRYLYFAPCFGITVTHLHVCFAAMTNLRQPQPQLERTLLVALFFAVFFLAGFLAVFFLAAMITSLSRRGS